MITGEQIRAARALLRVEQKDIADQAGISVETLKRYEATVGVITNISGNVGNLVTILERLGVLFIEGDGDLGYGVRLTAPAPHPLLEEVKSLSDEDLSRLVELAATEQKARSG